MMVRSGALSSFVLVFSPASEKTKTDKRPVKEIATMDPFIGEIRIFAGSYAPIGWALCNGQPLPISQNTALFSILGTAYGGDGITTFKLPNLQGLAPLMAGQGRGLAQRDLGAPGGKPT